MPSIAPTPDGHHTDTRRTPETAEPGTPHYCDSPSGTVYIDFFQVNRQKRPRNLSQWPRTVPSIAARDRWHRAWPAAQTSLCAGFAARSIAPCVARSLFLIAQTSLCAVFAAISAKTRQNLAVGGLCGLSCFRPSFRIVLADVCGPECRQTSLCAVFAKIVFSPTRNTKSNTKNRPLSNDMLYFILLKNTCSRLRETLL